jgi:hypothetical protein
MSVGISALALALCVAHFIISPPEAEVIQVSFFHPCLVSI